MLYYNTSNRRTNKLFLNVSRKAVQKGAIVDRSKKPVRKLSCNIIGHTYNYGHLFRNELTHVQNFCLRSRTMYHGTSFDEAATKISQSGKWYVGSGNYVGTGIYFGIAESTAKHYAPSGKDRGIIMSRVTLIFCKTVSTMKKYGNTLLFK